MRIDLDFKNLEIGSELKTKKGFIFTKTGEDTWRDETSGLIWLPIEKNHYTHYEAEELTDDYKRLPTIEEFEEAESHGIQEIVNFQDKSYWSFSHYEGDLRANYVFNSEYKYPMGYFRVNNAKVICIEK